MDVRTTSVPVHRRWAGYRHWIPVPLRRALVGFFVALVATVGAAVGLSLGSRTPVEVGPFNAEMRVTPALAGETEVAIPPLGALHLDTHDGPTRLTIALGALDQARTQEIITDPGGITRAAESVPQDVLDGVIRTGLGSLGAAVLGAMLLTGLVFRSVRRTAWAGGLALVLVGGNLAVAAATLRLDALEEPRYEGLLVNAPALIGDVQRIADDYQRYTEQLQQLVSNVSTLYTAASTLPVVPSESGIRVLHVSDLHLNPAAWSIIRTVVEQYGIDVIIDSGDIVDWGTGPEAEYLNSIRLMGVPYVYVRGNHDSALTQDAVAEQPNAVVLDDQVVEIAGLTIAGIGDPRFTPDQRTKPFDEGERAAIQQQVVDAGVTLAERIRQYPQPVQIAVVHDPSAAPPLAGTVPLVLAGHQHERRVEPLAPLAEQAAPGELPTLLMVQGSTGGAGLRGLEGEYPEPLALSVLYFDDELQLIAYDDITIGGHGLSEAAVQRHLIDLDEPEPAPSPSPTTTAGPD